MAKVGPLACLPVGPGCITSPPPPPSPPPPSPPPTSVSLFSTPVIVIIAVLGVAFILVSVYTLITRFCAFRHSLVLGRRRNRNHNQIGPGLTTTTTATTTAVGDNGGGVPGEATIWPVFARGLDEATICLIPVFRYVKGDGLLLVDETNCAVCLAEFRNGDCLRLLPKCSHAFHIACIDQWLQSQSTCPLCRANIVNPPLPPLPPPLPSDFAIHTTSPTTSDDEDNEPSSRPSRIRITDRIFGSSSGPLAVAISSIPRSLSMGSSSLSGRDGNADWFSLSSSAVLRGYIVRRAYSVGHSSHRNLSDFPSFVDWTHRGSTTSSSHQLEKEKEKEKEKEREEAVIDVLLPPLNRVHDPAMAPQSFHKSRSMSMDAGGSLSGKIRHCNPPCLSSACSKSLKGPLDAKRSFSATPLFSFRTKSCSCIY